MLALFGNASVFANNVEEEQLAQRAIDAGMNEISKHITANKLTKVDHEIIDAINNKVPAILNKIQRSSKDVEKELFPVVLEATHRLISLQTKYPQADLSVATQIFKKMLIANALAEDAALRSQGQPPLLTDTASKVLQDEAMKELNDLFQDVMSQTEAYMNTKPTLEEQAALKQQLLEMFPADMLQELYTEYGKDILDKFVQMTPQEQMDFIMNIFQKEAEKQKNKDQSYHRKAERDMIYKSLQTLRA